MFCFSLGDGDASLGKEILGFPSEQALLGGGEIGNSIAGQYKILLTENGSPAPGGNNGELFHQVSRPKRWRGGGGGQDRVTVV